MLTRRHLVVVLVDLHAHALHRRKHLGPDILAVVDRRHGEVAALDARAMAHVAHLVVGVCVPRCVDRVDLVGNLVDLGRKLHVVEQEEFRFGTPIGHVTDTGGLQISFRLFGRATRVAVISFAGVRFDNRTVNRHGLFGKERVHVGRPGVGHQFHVRLVDRLPAGDRRAVEHEAFVEEILVDLVRHDRHVLQLAARVGETDVDVFDILVLAIVFKTSLLLMGCTLLP